MSLNVVCTMAFRKTCEPCVCAARSREATSAFPRPAMPTPADAVTSDCSDALSESVNSVATGPTLEAMRL
jgi:hypothetical protein